MLVLGLDLALNITGWAVLDVEPDKFLAGGLIQTPSRRSKEELADWQGRRIGALADGILKLTQEYQPALLCYEYPDYVRSVWAGGTKGRESHAMYGLGFAAGALRAILLLQAPQVILRAVSTSEAKKLFTGIKTATKAGVAEFARLRYGEVVKDMPPDVTDAVAVACVGAALHGQVPIRADKGCG